MQEAFVRLWDRRDAIAADIPLRAWLYRTVRNLAFNENNNQVLPTLLANGSLTVGLINNGVRLTGPKNFATVTVANVVAKNGVIHVIDAVLLP